MVSDGSPFDWDVSGPGFVLSNVDDLFLISEGSLVSDNRHLSVGGGDLGFVFGLLDGVIPGLSLGLVLSLILDSVVGVEDGLVSDLLILSVEDLVLVGVSDFFFIVVLSNGVSSVLVLNFVPVSVFFLLSVKNIVARFPYGVWNISVVGLFVVVIDDSWDPLILGDVVWLILHLVVGGKSLFFARLVLGFRLDVDVRKWDLSCPELRLVLVVDGVLDLFVFDWHFNEFVGFTVIDVLMLVFIAIAGWWENTDCGRAGDNQG